jgi:hypothetical protein
LRASLPDWRGSGAFGCVRQTPSERLRTRVTRQGGRTAACQDRRLDDARTGGRRSGAGYTSPGTEHRLLGATLPAATATAAVLSVRGTAKTDSADRRRRRTICWLWARSRPSGTPWRPSFGAHRRRRADFTGLSAETPMSCPRRAAPLAVGHADAWSGTRRQCRSPRRSRQSARRNVARTPLTSSIISNSRAPSSRSPCSRSASASKTNIGGWNMQ